MNTTDYIGLWTKAGNYKQYSNFDSFTLEITDGADVTNSNLISWLASNATQIVEPDTPDVPIEPDTPDVPVEPVLELVPFLTNIANAIRAKKGTTAQINAQDFASEIASIEGGGATLKGGWAGTAVPICTLDSTEDDIIQNIYLNTQLSVEEVCNLIDECNKALNNGEKVEEFNLIVFSTFDKSIVAGLMYMQGVYVLVCGNIESENSGCFAYDITGAGYDVEMLGFSGWNTKINDVIEINTYNYVGLLSSLPSSVECNEVLKILFSITPFVENEPITLSGEYSPKSLTITENGSVDLTNYINDKKIVRNVDVKIKDLVSGLQWKLDKSCNANCLFVEMGTLSGVDEIANALSYKKVNSFHYTFAECKGLTKIVIDNEVTSTNDNWSLGFNSAFLYCSNVKTIDINRMAYSIGTSTFYGCESLTRLIIRNTNLNDKNEVLIFNDSAFKYCRHFTGSQDATTNPDGLRDAKIYVPDDVVEGFKTADGWSDFADLIYPLSEYVEE